MQILFTFHDWIREFAGRYKVVLIALVAVLLIGKWYSKHHSQQQKMFEVVSTPALDDVFIVDVAKLSPDTSSQSQFKIYQVSAIDNDTIHFRVGRYAYYRYRDIKRGIQLNQLMFDNYFLTEKVTWQRQLLPDYFDQGVVYEAHRPTDIYVLGGIVRHRNTPKEVVVKDRQDPDNQRAIRHYQTGEFALAREAFLLAAEKGDKWGQLNYAEMLRDGQGGKQDVSSAAQWFFTASQQGLAKASLALKTLCEEHKQKFNECAAR